MPQKLMDPTGHGWDESQLEWFMSWTMKGTWNPGNPLPEGFTFEEFEDHDSEPVLFGLLPLSGYQLENVGNSGLNRQQRRQAARQGTMAPGGGDGTDGLQMVSKTLKAVQPVQCKDKDGQGHEVGGLLDATGEQVGNKVNLDIVRGLPDWQILEITDHIELIRAQQERKEKK